MTHCKRFAPATLNADKTCWVGAKGGHRSQPGKWARHREPWMETRSPTVTTLEQVKV